MRLVAAPEWAVAPPPDEHNFGCNCMAGVETNRVAI